LAPTSVQNRNSHICQEHPHTATLTTVVMCRVVSDVVNHAKASQNLSRCSSGI